jgi:hypothetical protein
VAINQAKLKLRFPIWSVHEMGLMTAQEWKMVCCPRRRADCPAIIDEDDEMVCPQCKRGQPGRTRTGA